VWVRGGKGSVVLPLLKKLLSATRFDALMSKRFGLSDWKP
jgi:hypothetical protein